jgi:hypothetical protein
LRFRSAAEDGLGKIRIGRRVWVEDDPKTLDGTIDAHHHAGKVAPAATAATPLAKKEAFCGVVMGSTAKMSAKQACPDMPNCPQRFEPQHLRAPVLVTMQACPVATLRPT